MAYMAALENIGRGRGSTDRAQQLSLSHTKTTEGQHSPVRLEQARLVNRLLYGTWPLNSPAFENEKDTRILMEMIRMANSYEARTNQNARIYRKTKLQYDIFAAGYLLS